MSLSRISWKGLIYYGEVVGFLLAWVAGIVMISQGPDRTMSEVAFDQVASAESSLMAEPISPERR